MKEKMDMVKYETFLAKTLYISTERNTKGVLCRDNMSSLIRTESGEILDYLELPSLLYFYALVI